VEIQCACGRAIKRNKFGVEASGVMRCHDPTCKAIYDVQFVDDRIEYTQRQCSYECPHCQTIQYVSQSLVVDGVEFTCENCGKCAVLRSTFRAEAVDGNADKVQPELPDLE
jgi:hypothetical protein